jgi:hypothetical protein
LLKVHGGDLQYEQLRGERQEKKRKVKVRNAPKKTKVRVGPTTNNRFAAKLAAAASLPSLLAESSLVHRLLLFMAAVQKLIKPMNDRKNNREQPTRVGQVGELVSEDVPDLPPRRVHRSPIVSK